MAGASSSGSDAGDVGCTPGVQQCASDNTLETCGPNGQWGNLWTCATGNCSEGACTGSTTTGTSCLAASGAGLSNCGATSESCCTSLEVPWGTYYRTYTNSGTGATGQADPASISGFRLDKYLVTVGRFRQFVNAWSGGSGYLPAEGSGKHTHLNAGNGLVNSATELPDGVANGYETGWDATDWNNATNIDPTDANLEGQDGTWTAIAGSQENLPINWVNWYEAYAFCIWDGGFLPSEAEWEYAAVGGSEQLEYPWGSTAPGTACPGTGCEYAIYGCYYPFGGPADGGPGNCTGVANIAPVGTASYGAGRWEQLDLVGEVYEWNLDWSSSSYVDPCTDCAYLTATSTRVEPGGSFLSAASYVLLPNSGAHAPSYRNSVVGLRCARTP